MANADSASCCACCKDKSLTKDKALKGSGVMFRSELCEMNASKIL